MNTNYMKEILGTTDVVLFLIYMAFGLLGVAISMLWHISTRNKHSKDTPIGFSWSFFLKDNLQRIVTTVLVLFTCIRFAPEIIGKETTAYVAIAIGLGLDKLSEMLKNISLGARK